MKSTPLHSTPTQPNTNSTSPIEQIAAFQPVAEPEHIPLTSDRWILASNLQKSIRRGLVDVSLGTTSKLLTVDARYFWRRLMVIAYEDIGYGDIQLCHDLLKTFRRDALHRDQGPERVAQYFAHRLATARKSRSLCDALAMLEFCVRRGVYERQYAVRTDDEIIAAICDSSMPPIDRIAALRQVCGYGVVAGGWYKTLSKARPDLMREICSRLALPEMEATLFRSGQNVAESLNIPIPLISYMLRSSQAEDGRCVQAFEGQGGILFAALDRHTRTGKRSIARLAKEAGPILAFFTRRPLLDPVAVLGAAVFMAEGAELDHWLVFDGAAELRDQFNQNFLEYFGVIGDDQPELMALLASHRNRLNHIRTQEIAGLA